MQLLCAAGVRSWCVQLLRAAGVCSCGARAYAWVRAGVCGAPASAPAVCAAPLAAPETQGLGLRPSALCAPNGRGGWACKV